MNSNVHARSMIIDTDVAADDVMAITYLLHRADVKIQAITVAATGEAHCVSALQNLAGILRLVNKNHISLACGPAHPLKWNNHFPDFIRSDADSLAGTAYLLPQSKIVYPKGSMNLLVQVLQESQQPVDVLALGPLTNLGQLFLKHPELKNKIRMIYVMGGAITVPGNIIVLEKNSKNHSAEWNIYVDPVAADIVFRSGVAITLVPLDLTNQLPVDARFYQKLKQIRHTPSSKYIGELFHNEMQLFSEQWYFWDVLAGVIASDESFTVIENKKLRVVTEPGAQLGASIIDEKNGSLVRVSTSVDKEKFKNLFLQTIASA